MTPDLAPARPAPVSWSAGETALGVVEMRDGFLKPGGYFDQVLRARRIRDVVFCGVAANVCVESGLCEACHREYFCLLLQDATHHGGPAFLRQATLGNVERFFGWTAGVAEFERAAGLAAPVAEPACA